VAVDDTATQFLYDGVNVIQERADLSSQVVNASYLTGFAIDEVLSRTEASAKSEYLRDRVGNTIALANANLSLSTQYQYEPYGASTRSGSADQNNITFAGRNADGAGLIYMRARYYDPETGQFLSEDPLGLSGGLANLYSYVGGDPVNNIDPMGLAAGAGNAALCAKAREDLGRCRRRQEKCYKGAGGMGPLDVGHQRTWNQAEAACLDAMRRIKVYCEPDSGGGPPTPLASSPVPSSNSSPVPDSSASGSPRPLILFTPGVGPVLLPEFIPIFPELPIFIVP
jgi:RHS repeat-associated protein